MLLIIPMETNCFRCRSLMLVGDDSPHMDDVVNMNGRMDPEETDFMKVSKNSKIKMCKVFTMVQLLLINCFWKTK